MEEFLHNLGINGEFNYNDDSSLVMDIKDSNQYGSIYSKLDRCEELEEDSDASNITYEASNIQFSNDIYLITLVGDLEADTYKLVMKKI